MSNISRINNKPTNTTSSTSTTTISSSSTTQACAACKYQRRKCTPDCLLAPYFPHDRPRQFLNAHKLFGVSNITKIIKQLSPLEKDEAMKTIMFQADTRAMDPVGGCFRIVLELQRQIEYHKRELDLVLHQLALCRAQAAAGHQSFDVQNPQLPVAATANNPGQSQGGDDDQDRQELIENTNGSALDVYDPMLTQQEVHHGINPHHHRKDQHQDHHHHQVSSWTMPILQESSVTSSSSSFQANNNNNDHNNHKQGSGDGGDHSEQCSINPEMNPSFMDVNDIKFEIEELVERRFVPSTELVMSS